MAGNHFSRSRLMPELLIKRDRKAIKVPPRFLQVIDGRFGLLLWVLLLHQRAG